MEEGGKLVETCEEVQRFEEDDSFGNISKEHEGAGGPSPLNTCVFLLQGARQGSRIRLFNELMRFIRLWEFCMWVIRCS